VKVDLEVDSERYFVSIPFCHLSIAEVAEDADSMKDEAVKGLERGKHCCVVSAVMRWFDNVMRYMLLLFLCITSPL
jgi:hypothetical protein